MKQKSSAVEGCALAGAQPVITQSTGKGPVKTKYLSKQLFSGKRRGDMFQQKFVAQRRIEGFSREISRDEQEVGDPVAFAFSETRGQRHSQDISLSWISAEFSALPLMLIMDEHIDVDNLPKLPKIQVTHSNRQNFLMLMRICTFLCRC